MGSGGCASVNGTGGGRGGESRRGAHNVVVAVCGFFYSFFLSLFNAYTHTHKVTFSPSLNLMERRNSNSLNI